MREFLDDLLAEHPDGLSVQIIAGGAPFSGAIRATDHDGVYEMKVVTQHPQTRQAMLVSVFVAADHVASVLVVTDDMASSITAPPSGLVLPRAS